MADKVLIATERVFPTKTTSAVAGVITLSWSKFLWLALHGIIGIAGIFLFPELNAALIFIALTAITICAGHSVGMHRLLIHRSFTTSHLIEYILVWLGTLVGMAGPFGMIRAHDMRDWHQRQTICPPHPSHSDHFWTDAWWQLCCMFDLKNPPEFAIEHPVASDPIYRMMERTWMAQQLPIGLILYAFGGWAFVCWGISLRIFVSLTGHWMVGHFAHKQGNQTWRIDGLPVQGYNLPKVSLLTFGEGWHGNHHAFPHSAKLGVLDGEADIGFGLIRLLERLGLVWNIKLPDSEPAREGLTKT